jgi:hypothetical protein
MKRSLTVFVCSTYTDLVDERERVLEGIRRLQLQHDAMEFFGARPGRSIETCLAEVRRSDVLVVIVGHRYGSIVAEFGISFCEAEYREGYSLGKPCLVYVRDEDVPVLPRHVERDPDKLRFLESWKTTLASRHTVGTFSDSQQLALQVVADLGRTVEAIEQYHGTQVEANNRGSILGEVRSLLDDATANGLSQQLILSQWRRVISDLLSEAGRRRPVVFLSHSHRDKEIVRAMAKGLRSAGIDLWLDEAELTLGDSIMLQLEKGLDSADFVAFFISRATLNSRWAQAELNAAMSRQLSGARGPIVFPILLDDVEIPALLKSVMYLDLRDGDVPKAVTRLVRDIEHYLTERRGQGATAAVSRPFPPMWKAEDFSGKSATEVESFFATELVPEAMDRARREWEGVEARGLPEKIRARATELAARKAKELGLAERWDEWRRLSGAPGFDRETQKG